jgi:carboxymethylenebutenolidase
MQKILILVFLFVYSVVSYSQEIPVCGLSPNAEFISLANDESFVNKHELPEPLLDFEPKGKMIEFPVYGSPIKGKAYLLRNNNSNTWLLVFHEWWGLNEHIKKESDKYFEALNNVNVLAIDLYDGKVGTTREEARQFMQAVEEERAEGLIRGAMTFAGASAEFYSIGWCFGGGWSLKSALMGAGQSKKCVIYYGWPETDPEKLSVLNAKVLGIFGTLDKGISPELVKKFQEGMSTAEKNLQVKMYEADHAFANPSSVRYKKESAQDAFSLTLKFLRE